MTNSGRGLVGRLEALMLLIVLIWVLFIVGLLILDRASNQNKPEGHQEGQEDVLAVEQYNVIVEVQMPNLEPFPSFEANVSAYCSCATCTAPYNDGLTASGQPVQENKTIAMGKQFPLGTLIVIEGFDGIVFEVQDRGGAITGNKVDIYFPTHSEAVKFGRQKLQVWILRFGAD